MNKNIPLRYKIKAAEQKRRNTTENIYQSLQKCDSGFLQFRYKLTTTQKCSFP